MPPLRAAVLGLALTLLFAACGAVAPSSGATAGSDSTPGVTPAPGDTASPLETAPPAGSEAPTSTGTPTSSDSPAVTDEPTPTEVPSDPPETVVPDQTPGTADACSGTADNRLFFARFARAVDWTVLCGVLPRGWFVSQGSYRLANGGKLLMAYKGPGGSTLALSEGAWCAMENGCVPSGSTLGGAPLGPLAGTLYQTGDGFAIHVAPGENPSWLMTTTGLDQATTLALAAKLAEVGG
jgi:hypothetical protein